MLTRDRCSTLYYHDDNKHVKPCLHLQGFWEIVQSNVLHDFDFVQVYPRSTLISGILGVLTFFG